MSSQYEIEIKSLLGNKEKAEALRGKISERNGHFVSKNNQLNHYFIVSDASKFKKTLLPFIQKHQKTSFEKILDHGKKFSVRTRDIDGQVLLVIKASLGDDTSANGVSRIELESQMNMTLDELDKILLGAGLEYQAKWSREREEYKLGDVNVCVDKNAGYGYLAEFEKIVLDRNSVDSVKQELLDLLREFGVEELSQDRLERMFAHYNANWQDYYGTEKVFNIE